MSMDEGDGRRLGLLRDSWQQERQAGGEWGAAGGCTRGGRQRLPTSGPLPAAAAARGEAGVCSFLARFLARPAARGGMSANSSASAPTWTGQAAGLRRCRQSGCHPMLLQSAQPARSSATVRPGSLATLGLLHRPNETPKLAKNKNVGARCMPTCATSAPSTSPRAATAAAMQLMAHSFTSWSWSCGARGGAQGGRRLAASARAASMCPAAQASPRTTPPITLSGCTRTPPSPILPPNAPHLSRQALHDAVVQGPDQRLQSKGEGREASIQLGIRRA